MGRTEEVKDGENAVFHLGGGQKDRLQKLADRDYSGNISALGREMCDKWLQAHEAGNAQYVLDDFSKHKDLIAIPALMSNKQDLSKYVQSEQSYEELKKVLEQCEFFQGIIRDKILNLKENPDKAKVRRMQSERMRRQNDIRFKDPKNLSWNERLAYSRIKSSYGFELVCPNTDCGFRFCDSTKDEDGIIGHCKFCNTDFDVPEPEIQNAT